MTDTPEMIRLAKEVKANTELLLNKHYEDNADIIRNSIAWKKAANNDMTSRGALYELCSKQGDSDMEPEERAEIIANSVMTWMQVFGYVNSPKTKIKNLPLVLFPFQERLIRDLVLSIERGSDMLIEKSREMGVSWIVMYVFVWYWLFKPGSNLLIGSYKEALVTDGTIDSMFGKVVYIIDCLPLWMLPRGFKKKTHITRKKIENPQLRSYITGDTMNADFGRGARKTAIFFDELGFWDYAKSAWEASGETTDCRIGNSTPNGYNFYKTLIDSGLHTLRLHWKEHPLKDELWYSYKRMKETKEAIAREIDISYEASRVGVIYSNWKTHVRKGNMVYDPSLPLYVTWDFGRADGTAMIWCQVRDGRLIILDAYYKKGVKLIDYFVPLVTGRFITEYQYEDYDDDALELIDKHSTWKKAVHYGDPAGNQKVMNQDYTVIETLRAHGIHVNVNYARNSHNARQSDTQKIIMRGIDMNETNGTQWLDVSMLNYAFSSTNVDGVQIIKTNAAPRHDEYSHMATAFEYLCVGLMGLKNTDKKNYADKFSGGKSYGSKIMMGRTR